MAVLVPDRVLRVASFPVYLGAASMRMRRKPFHTAPLHDLDAGDDLEVMEPAECGIACDRHVRVLAVWLRDTHHEAASRKGVVVLDHARAIEHLELGEVARERTLERVPGHAVERDAG